MFKHPRWDYYALLNNLGSVAEVRKMIGDAGFDVPPRETVQGWRTRNSVPSPWVPVLIQLGFDHGVIKRIDDLVLETKLQGKPDADTTIFE